MMIWDREFMVGGVGKAALMCVPISGFVVWAWGWWGALAIWVGLGLGAANLWAMAWLMSGLMGESRTSGWLAAFFGLKLLVLFGLTYYLIAVLGLGALGFVTGYMICLGGLMWQAASSAQEGERGENESKDGRTDGS